MRPAFVSLSGLALLAISAGCDHTMNPKPVAAVEQYVVVPNAVPFDIEPVRGAAGTTTWLATYTTQGKTARFRLEFAAAKPLDDKGSKEFHVASGKGRFLAETRSDASILLEDLKRALEAKHAPTGVTRVPGLPFAYVSLGEHSSQGPDGGFFVDPPGNWSPTKVFVGEGENEGEFFVNINPAMKKGQFSMNDPDYGDIVLAQLATVL